MPIRRSLALTLSLLAFVAAACGGDDANPTVQDAQPEPTMGGETAQDTGSGGAPAQGVVEIKMRDFQFVPSTAQIKVGQEVTWRNEDDAPHNATAEGTDLSTRDIGKGETVEYTPEQPGTIEYICTIHPNMKGTLEVADN